MRYIDIVEKDTEKLNPPSIDVGNLVFLGKFKNKKATVTGFSKDKNNQPVLKTSKGETSLFKPRIAKLMKNEDE